MLQKKHSGQSCCDAVGQRFVRKYVSTKAHEAQIEHAIQSDRGQLFLILKKRVQNEKLVVECMEANHGTAIGSGGLSGRL